MKKLYTLYDKKMNIYMSPIVYPNVAVVTRDLQEIVNTQPETKIAKYPEDHDLYLLGTFDEISGEIITLPKPELVINLSELKGKTS